MDPAFASCGELFSDRIGHRLHAELARRYVGLRDPWRRRASCSSGGWEVYTLGESRCAKAVAALLDEAKLEEKRNAANQLSLQACRELSWKLLPRTVVVAIHRPTGTACLLRDGWGFTCLYYCVRGDSVIFSTCLAALRSVASSTSINTDKLSEMLLYGHRGGNRTVWQEVNIVAPGYTVCCYPGRSSQVRILWGSRSAFSTRVSGTG